jgi:hypothetical protein
MVATLNLNPVITTVAAGTFAIDLDGFTQGMALDDPAMRFQLTGGQLDPTETLPMWGGVPITEYLSAVEPQATKPMVRRATTPVLVTGFSVFNQNHAMINTPQSQVPVALSGMLVNLYRLGSLARIPLSMDPALSASLPTNPITPFTLYWNPTNFWVTGTAAGAFLLPAGLKVVGWNSGNSMTVAYDPVTGFTTWVRNGNCILLQI